MNQYSLTTQQTSAATPLHGAESVAPSMAAHDSRPADIEAAFARDGLLVRTVQQQKAHGDLENCHLTVDQARTLQAQGKHSGLRKWTLAQTDLKPNFYKMGPEATGMPRHMAFLALPDKVGEHVVGVHDKDASSGNVTADTRIMSSADARMDLNKMLGRLKSNQSERPNAPLENNEVQTVGVEPAAIAGMLFHPTVMARDWAAAKGDFQKAIDKGGADFAGRTFPVFTYEVNPTTNKTELRLLDNLTKQS